MQLTPLALFLAALTSISAKSHIAHLSEITQQENQDNPHLLKVEKRTSTGLLNDSKILIVKLSSSYCSLR